MPDILDRTDNCITYCNCFRKTDCDTKYFTMSDSLINELIDYCGYKTPESILIIDDAGFQLIEKLYNKCKNITLCLTRVVVDDEFQAIKELLECTFNNIKINIINYSGVKPGMKFDLIIANPPYGDIGANIAYNIRNTIDYCEFVNLLPANDYNRNDDKNLYQYASDMKPMPENSFKDASVQTHLSRIHKNKVNSMSADEFIISQYVDRTLDKYFIKNFNSKPNSKAVNHISSCLPESKLNIINSDNTFILGVKDTANKHMPYSKDVFPYRWNSTSGLTQSNLVGVDKDQRLDRYPGIIFNSPEQKNNFYNFMYSDLGFKFISKVFVSMNQTSRVSVEKWYPNVDWSRPWTVEEILKDYGYTEEEVKEVVDDLKNFKSMEA